VLALRAFIGLRRALGANTPGAPANGKLMSAISEALTLPDAHIHTHLSKLNLDKAE
jgi:hypothetical protein